MKMLEILNDQTKLNMEQPDSILNVIVSFSLSSND